MCAHTVVMSAYIVLMAVHTVVVIAYTVVVCVGVGGPDKHGASKVVFRYFTQWLCGPTKWLCLPT